MSDTAQGMMARWNREILSFVYAGILTLLFVFASAWDPITHATGRQGALFVCGLLMLYLFYLTWQAWPLVRGEVGTAFSHTTDAIFSAIPLFPVVVAVAFHLFSASSQSFTNLVIATSTIGVVAFDVLVFGGVGSLVNRLTHDIYGKRA